MGITAPVASSDFERKRTEIRALLKGQPIDVQLGRSIRSSKAAYRS